MTVSEDRKKEILAYLEKKLENYSRPQEIWLDINATTEEFATIVIPNIAKFNPNHLHIGCNPIHHIPKEIVQLSGLEELITYGDTPIQTLSPEFYSLKNLKRLELGFTEISELSPDIRNLQQLKKISMEYGKLEKIPKELFSLTNLEEIFFSENPFTNNILRPEIGNLSKLKKIWLRESNIAIVPDEIGALTKLEDLVLSDNKISFLPKTMRNLKALRTLYLGENPYLVDIGSALELAETHEFSTTNCPAFGEWQIYSSSSPCDINGNYLPELDYNLHRKNMLVAQKKSQETLEKFKIEPSFIRENHKKTPQFCGIKLFPIAVEDVPFPDGLLENCTLKNRLFRNCNFGKINNLHFENCTLINCNMANVKKFLMHHSVIDPETFKTIHNIGLIAQALLDESNITTEGHTLAQSRHLAEYGSHIDTLISSNVVRKHTDNPHNSKGKNSNMKR